MTVTSSLAVTVSVTQPGTPLRTYHRTALSVPRYSRMKLICDYITSCMQREHVIGVRNCHCWLKGAQHWTQQPSVTGKVGCDHSGEVYMYVMLQRLKFLLLNNCVQWSVTSAVHQMALFGSGERIHQHLLYIALVLFLIVLGCPSLN